MITVYFWLIQHPLGAKFFLVTKSTTFILRTSFIQHLRCIIPHHIVPSSILKRTLRNSLKCISTYKKVLVCLPSLVTKYRSLNNLHWFSFSVNGVTDTLYNLVYSQNGGKLLLLLSSAYCDQVW